MIEQDLYTQLKDNVAGVGGRVYPLTAPQDAVKPYITYQVVSDNSKQCIGGSIYENDTRFQVDIYSQNYGETKAIKEEVVTAIVGFKSSYGISANDGYTEQNDLYRQIVDFTLKG